MARRLLDRRTLRFRTRRGIREKRGV